MYKMTLKFEKSWDVLFLDNSSEKLDEFALNLQYKLSLQEVRDKTKEVLIKKW